MMTKTVTPAASYWADSALGYFETMAPKQAAPGEAAASSTANAQRGGKPETRRQWLPALKPSQAIQDVIAACAPSRQIILTPSVAVLKAAKALMPA